MIELTLTAIELRRLMTESMDLGAKRTLVELGLISPYLTKSQAYKIYGRAQVDRWIENGLITLIKDGTNTSKYRISRIDLELVSKTSNRTSWYTHHPGLKNLVED